METLWHDLRYGLRMLVKTPSFVVVAVLALGLGIGANTAIFSVVNGVLLNPLPYEDPDRLVMVWGHHSQIGRETASYPDFMDWRAQNQSFEDLVAITRRSMNLTGNGEPERLIAAGVTAGLFPLLGVQPVHGRPFSQEEDQPGAERVAILGHGLWERRFGGDASIVGQSITLNSEPVTVVGIAPPAFRFPGRVDVWVPLALDVNQTGRRGDFLRVLGRLRPAVSFAQAQAEMVTIARRLEEQYPQTNAGWSVELVPLHEQVVENVRPALLLLTGAVGFVLLIACANVANLLLARAATREKEIAIRVALGAGRRRLIAQLLTESVLLALAGGGLGLLVAFWGIDALLALNPGALPRQSNIGIDTAVLGFTLGLSLLTGLIFGLVPAFQASEPDLNESLKEGGRGSVGISGIRLRQGLVVSQVVLALVLLVGAGLLVQSFYRLRGVDPGYDPTNILTLRVKLPRARYAEDHQVVGFYRQLGERVAALPGVESVSATDATPVGGSGPMLSFSIDGRPDPPPEQVQDAYVRSVLPGYFRTLQLPLVLGRDFSSQDHQETTPVAIINQTLARRYWANENPIGQRLDFEGSTEDPRWREIVGVMADVKQEGLDVEAYPELVVPHSQRPSRSLRLLVRTGGDPRKRAGMVKSEAHSLDDSLPVYSVLTLESMLADEFSQRRFAVILLGLFAALALVLAAVGLYGVMAYVVSQRTREIGIRMAMGARPGDVLRLVVGQGMALTLIGIAVGLAGSLVLKRFLAGFLFGVSATDPVTYGGVALLLAGVALAASYAPARRATHVDPLEALRYE